MQRSLVVALIILFFGAVGAAWWFLRGEVTPPSPVSTAPTSTETGAAPSLGGVTGAEAGGPTAALREAVAGRDSELLDDPEIRAGLCGFKGRVVTHLKVPVADCGVRIYRGAMDSILPVDFDLFAPESTYAPNYIAGETKTATDGTWQLTGVWPRALHLLYAGIGTDAPMHQVVTRTPSPGEIVDLGDIVLPDAGVITGTVVDDNGDPLAGALVRAADIPGTVAAFFPFERIDPEGAMLVREGGFPQKVVVFPPWVKTAFDHLPVPTTRTATDGRFRLVGVVPGSNMVATTAVGFLSDVKPSIQVRAGQEKNVGTIRMKRGEELNGRVLDSAGKPIADAEVFAGSTLTVAPVDIAQKLGRTDAEGRFTGEGFAAGKVSVAARRGRGHAWTLAEPQSILGDVVVTLPATFAVEATVTLADGKPAKDARLKLLQGRLGNGAAEMYLLGIAPAIELTDRKQDLGEGRWRIGNLLPGSYSLVADAAGHSTAFATFDIAAADVAVTIALSSPDQFVVVVVDPNDKPIRNAAVYGQARGKNLIEMPVLCGRTGADGKLTIDKLQGESIRVSADHPKWGVAHGETKRNQSVTLRMQSPGALHGTLFENGKPPDVGKFQIAVERRGGEGPRGPLEATPMLLSPGIDGTFAAAVLQPGSYRVHAIKGVDALRSPGGIFALAQEAFMSRDLPSETVTVVAGQTVEVQLDAGEKALDGPTAHLSGSLMVDGRLGAGHVVVAHARNRRFTARVDDRGRFDLGTVAAGDLWVRVLASTEDAMFGPDNSLWSGNVKLTEGETRELAIDVQTSSISGVCVDAAGAPVPGMRVQAQGHLKGDARKDNVWMTSVCDAQGAFTFPKVAEGTWSLSVRGSRGRSEAGVQGKLEGIEVTAGSPVTGLQLVVQPAVMVRGRIDLASLGNKPRRWGWVGATRLRDEEPPDARGTRETGFGFDPGNGSFSTDELTPGRYRLRLHVGFDDDTNGQYALDMIVVPPAGLSDLVLRPGARTDR